MRARAIRTSFALIVAMCFAAGVALVGVAPASASEVPAPGQGSSSQVTAADAASDGSTLAASSETDASAEAVSTGEMVNVAADTTDDSITWANPDGSFTTQTSDGPVRVADSATSSGWHDIDDTLVENPDGSVSAAYAYLPLTLSGAASASAVAQTGLVAVADGEGSTLKFGWTGALPLPEISGNTATYVGVEPNMNIVITLTATGFEEFFVLTSAPTASELNLVLPLSTPGLTAEQQDGGGLNLVDAAANQVGTIGQSLMWDARTDPESGLPTDEVPLSVSASNGALDVTSPASFFADPNIQYPVTIDPGYNKTSTGDTFVRSDFPTTKYASYDPTELQVGTYNGGTTVARAYLNFPSTGWLNNVIEGATLDLYEFHSYSCTPYAIYAQRVTSGLETANTDWDAQPTRTGTHETYATVAHGYSSSCPAATFGINVMPEVNDYTSGSTIAMALVSGNESADDGWKRMNSSDNSSGKPTLIVTWYTPAATPPAPSFSTPLRTCETSTPSTYVNGTQDTYLTSTVSDVDLPSMTDTAQVFAATETGSTWAPTGSPVYTTAPSGTATSGSVYMRIPAGTLSAGTYAANAQTDYVATGGSAADSAWSSYCYFTVKDTGPALPSITDETGPATRVGGSMTVHFSGPDTGYSTSDSGQAGVFAYWWVPNSLSTSPMLPEGIAADVGTNPASFPATGSGLNGVQFAAVSSDVSGTLTSDSVVVAPPNQSATLWVASFDAEGNPSTNGGSPASVAAGLTLPSLAADPNVTDSFGHEWLLDGTLPLPNPIADTNPNTGTATTDNSPLTLGSTSTGSTVDPSLAGVGSVVFTGNDTDTIRSSQQVVDTTQPFTVSAWVQPNTADTGATQIAVSQAATGSGSAAFRLGISSGGEYEFCVRPQETPGSAVCAHGDTAADATAAFIVGIWDPVNRQIRVLVGDDIEQKGAASYTLPSGEISSTGPLLVGADYVGGSDADLWDGYIADPTIFPGIADATQVDNLWYSRLINH